MAEKKTIETKFRALQNHICQELERIDGKGKFKEDSWKREGGGGGFTRIIQGELIEKGGVNFSAVFGNLPDKIASALKINAAEFYATGVSIVLHPFNPFMPIIHMNIRYFEMDDGTWWFGGGIDLTPHYIDLDEARDFHQKLKSVCDSFSSDYYQKFKDWADRYFFIKHRKESRGIGGIFFDRLGDDEEINKEELFQFVLAVGNSFPKIYESIALNKRDRPFDENNKDWQMLRRSRYVEFNLVWDKGTKFGLDTDGRTESILMSLPPSAKWAYNLIPEKNSSEEATMRLLSKPVNWLDEDT